MAMTTEGAYLACKNPNCKSAGKSHPNCRCYGGRGDIIMAEGGKVPHFCDQGVPHDKSCEYYADGGQVDTPPLHEAGKKVLGEALERGLFKGHHKHSDALLGHKDPSPLIAGVMANGGAPGLLKLSSNSVFDPRVAAKPRLMEDRRQQLLSGLGAARQAGDPNMNDAIEKGLEQPWFRNGIKLHNQLPELTTGQPVEHELGQMASRLAGRELHGSAKHMAAPAAMKLIAQGASPDEFEQGMAYTEHAGKGINKISKGVDSIFSRDSEAPELIDGRARSKLHDFIKSGQLHDETTAAGQDAEDTPVTEGTEPLAKHFPDHNMMLQASRQRVVSYLNSLRPVEKPGLPFDKPFATKLQERTYNNALDLANDPLSILKKIKTGTISHTDVAALQGMYPELGNQLREQITERLSEAQFKRETVLPKTRRALSAFLGTPLDSTMTPESIQNIQGMFAKQRQAAAQQAAPKKSTAKLTKEAEGAQTASQALAARQQRPR